MNKKSTEEYEEILDNIVGASEIKDPLEGLNHLCEWGQKAVDYFRKHLNDEMIACNDCLDYCPDLGRCSLIMSEKNKKDWEAGLYPENCPVIKRRKHHASKTK